MEMVLGRRRTRRGKEATSERSGSFVLGQGGRRGSNDIQFKLGGEQEEAGGRLHKAAVGWAVTR